MIVQRIPAYPLDRRREQRDAAVRRLRKATTFSLAGAGAVAALVAGVAARSFHGRTVTIRTSTATTAPARTRAVAHAPALVPVDGGASSPETPAPPAAAPAPTQAPPVVVSGGS